MNNETKILSKSKYHTIQRKREKKKRREEKREQILKKRDERRNEKEKENCQALTEINKNKTKK